MESDGAKLPKIYVPTFDGNLMNWTAFWEHFEVSVHCKSNVRNSCTFNMHWKGDSAKQAIEGLTKSVITMLRQWNALRTSTTGLDWFIKPIGNHRHSHFKEGIVKELRHLYDVAQQHLKPSSLLGMAIHCLIPWVKAWYVYNVRMAVSQSVHSGCPLWWTSEVSWPSCPSIWVISIWFLKEIC